MPLKIEDYPAELLSQKNLAPSANGLMSLLANEPYQSPLITTFGSYGTGSNKWAGGVLANDGHIYGIPQDATSILEINPENRSVSTWGASGTAQNKWIGGALAPNGKIYCAPDNASTVLEIDPINKTHVAFGALGTVFGKWQGAFCHPLNGKIYCFPTNATSILEINPETRALRHIYLDILTSKDWSKGVYHPNGYIYMLPLKGTQIAEVDVLNETYSLFGTLPASTSTKYNYPVVHPNGNIYCAAGYAANHIKINPTTREIEYSEHSSGTVGSIKWAGGAVGPNGKLYFVPYGAQSIIEIDPDTLAVLAVATFTTMAGKWRGMNMTPNGKLYAIPGYAASVVEVDTLMLPKNPSICYHPSINDL